MTSSISFREPYEQAGDTTIYSRFSTGARMLAPASSLPAIECLEVLEIAEPTFRERRDSQLANNPTILGRVVAIQDKPTQRLVLVLRFP